MRIISGKAKGIRLNAPISEVVRPTEDRVKETLFSILGDMTRRVVLDLFSGTGALGLEALSRGADFVVFVERDQTQAENLQKNLNAVGKVFQDISQKTLLLRTDVCRLPELLPPSLRKQSLDLILADPPYNPPAGSYGGRELLLDTALPPLLAPECQLVLEHETGTTLPWAPFSQWQLLRQRSFGIRTLSFAEITTAI